MAPSVLQGLTIVHPTTPTPPSKDLLYPDLTNNLDLWTNLAFASDEPFLASQKNISHPHGTDPDDDADEEDSPSPPHDRRPAPHESHVNVVTGTDIALPQHPQHPPPPSFDIGTFLAGFGIDPFGLPPAPAPQPQSQSQSPSQPGPAALPNLSPAEDKRRRNTAASARFRMKKKEREAALEGKAKELEGRVSELERECESLRRENGWLKGLVIGVTGAAAQPQPQPQPAGTGSKRSREEGPAGESELKPSKMPLNA